MSDSLIEAAQAQPDLLPTQPGSFFAELEVKGEFTGERLFAQRPDAYKSAVILLGQGMGMIRIGKLLGISPNTVMAVRDREGGSIDAVKTHLARVAHAAATLGSELILEKLNELARQRNPLSTKDLKDLAITYGIMVQNGQLLAGQPTARVEVHEIQKPGHEDFNRYISSLPQAKVTHLEGEKVPQKEGGDLTSESDLTVRGPERPSTVDEPAPSLEPARPGAGVVVTPAPGTDERSEGQTPEP